MFVGVGGELDYMRLTERKRIPRKRNNEVGGRKRERERERERHTHTYIHTG